MSVGHKPDRTTQPAFLTSYSLYHGGRCDRSLDEWMSFLADARLAVADSDYIGPGAANALQLENILAGTTAASGASGMMDESQARLCLAWSTAFCSDELKRRPKLTTATYVDFLEAIARLCTFTPLPTAGLLEEYQAKSAKEFFDMAASGINDGVVMLGTISWEAEEASEEPLAGTLEMMINLILDRMESLRSGRFDRKIFARLRVERQRQLSM